MSLNSLLIGLGALLPSAGVAFLFYLVIKAMLEGDRRERLAHSQWEAEQELQASTAKRSRDIEERDSAF
jgi:hypothetical protein